MNEVTQPGLWARRGLLRRALGGLLLVPLCATLIAPTLAHADDAATAVKIDNFAFVPQTLKIKPGTVVTWTNDDDIPHTVVAIGTNLRSKTVDTGQTFTYKFDKPGTFNYICALHPHMKGQIVVAP